VGDSQAAGTVAGGQTKYSRVSKMTQMYLFRSLNHGHRVVPKVFRPQAQACLDRAHLPSHYPSGHVVT